MNKERKYILPLAGLLLALFAASCQDDIDLNGGNGTVDYGDDFFILSDINVPQSRVAYDAADINESYFESGDIVGVFALNADNTPVTGQPGNVKYEVHAVAGNIDNPEAVSHRVLRPATDAALPTNCPKYFFYYPYRDGISYEDLTGFTHSVQTDQSEKGDLTASDLLWDIAVPEGKYCHVEMDHAMAQIIVLLNDRNYSIEKGVELSGLKVATESFNLLAENLDEMTYNATGEAKDSLKMWSFGYSNKGQYQLRFAIPAQKVSAGTHILTAYTEDGATKTFTLGQDQAMDMKPGYNYYFTISKKPVPILDPSDEDSWVLDVLDPVTGDQVGLLCREYIRYQPKNTLTLSDKDNHQADQITYPLDEANNSKNGGHTLQGITMSSQAWVFYNMDGNVPDLTQGQILRVIYDVRSNFTGEKGVTAMGGSI